MNAFIRIFLVEKDIPFVIGCVDNRAADASRVSYDVFAYLV